jgi:hypothetical protein
VRAPGPACTQCGLLAEHAHATNFLPPPSLRDHWRLLWDRWDDAVAHQHFRQTALMQGELAEAGRLYQLRLARLPGDPQAERGRSELLQLASTAEIDSPRRLAPSRIRQLGWAALMLISALLAALVARGLLAN